MDQLGQFANEHPVATAAGIGGIAGGISGLFSDQPGAVLKRTLLGAGAGAGLRLGYDWLRNQPGEQPLANPADLQEGGSQFTGPPSIPSMQPGGLNFQGPLDMEGLREGGRHFTGPPNIPGFLPGGKNFTGPEAPHEIQRLQQERERLQEVLPNYWPPSYQSKAAGADPNVLPTVFRSAEDKFKDSLKGVTPNPAFAGSPAPDTPPEAFDWSTAQLATAEDIAKERAKPVDWAQVSSVPGIPAPGFLPDGRPVPTRPAPRPAAKWDHQGFAIPTPLGPAPPPVVDPDVVLPPVKEPLPPARWDHQGFAIPAGSPPKTSEGGFFPKPKVFPVEPRGPQALEASRPASTPVAAESSGLGISPLAKILKSPEGPPIAPPGKPGTPTSPRDKGLVNPAPRSLTPAVTNTAGAAVVPPPTNQKPNWNQPAAPPKPKGPVSFTQSPTSADPDWGAKFLKDTGTAFDPKSRMDAENMKRLRAGQSTLDSKQYRRLGKKASDVLSLLTCNL